MLVADGAAAAAAGARRSPRSGPAVRDEVGYTIASSFCAANMPSTAARTIGRPWSRTDV